MNSRRNKLMIVAVILVGICFFVGRNHQELFDFTSSKSAGIAPVEKVVKADKKSYAVKTIELVSGDIFDIILEEGNTRILAKLDVFTTRTAKEKVRAFVNKCTNPRVILKEKVIGLPLAGDTPMWMVDLYVTHQGQEIRLSDWLSQNNLVYK